MKDKQGVLLKKGQRVVTTGHTGSIVIGTVSAIWAERVQVKEADKPGSLIRRPEDLCVLPSPALEFIVDMYGQPLELGQKVLMALLDDNQLVLVEAVYKKHEQETGNIVCVYKHESGQLWTAWRKPQSVKAIDEDA